MAFPLIYLAGALVFSYKKPHMGLFLFFVHFVLMMWVGIRFEGIDHRLMGTVGTVLLYGIIASNFSFVKEKFKFYRFYLFFNLAFFVQLLVLSFYHGVELTLYISFFRNYFHYFLLLPLTLMLFSSNRQFQFLKWFKIFIFIEAILILGQLLSPLIHQFLVVEYIETGGDIQQVVSQKISEGNLAVGTFLKPANLGNFLAILIPSGFFFGYRNFQGRKKLIFYSFLGFLLFFLLQTGIRTSIISFAFFAFIVLFLLNKKYFFSTLMISAIFIIVNIGLLKNISESYDSTEAFDNPISRVISGLLQLQDDEYMREESTLSRTINILSQAGDIIFGNSKLISGGRYFGVDSTSDAQLSFLFVEFGIITFLLCLLPFVYPLYLLYKKSRNDKIFFRFGLALFGCVLLQTITDQGLFTVYSAALYFVILGALINYQNTLFQTHYPFSEV